MGLNEYSKQYGLHIVTEIFYVILAQYSGHYFSGSLVRMKLAVKDICTN